MQVQTTYPGVYVQEVASGVRTITGVSTSTALFIGASKKGPINKPVQCFNYSSFRNQFGDDASAGQLANYVKLFFLNGGSLCWVMRIATGASPSSVILKTEAGINTLELTAKDEGIGGDTIRAKISYNGAQPEATFSLDLFRLVVDPSGNKIVTDPETWVGLSMDPASPTFAADFITQNSKLVNATNLIAGPGTAKGVSVSGRAVPDAGGGSGFRDAWKHILGTLVQPNTFKISVGGRPYVDINLQGFLVTNAQVALTGAISNAVNTGYAALGIPGVNVAVSFTGSATARRLRIESAVVNEDVYIRPGKTFPPTLPATVPATDLTVSLMLGTEQGGVEVSAYAARRPAPNGLTLKASDPTTIFAVLDSLAQSGFTPLQLESLVGDLPGPLQAVAVQPPVTPNVQTTAAADLFTKDAFVTSRNGNADGVREKLQIISQVINSFTAPAGQTWPWRAEVWGYRLAILPVNTTKDDFISAAATIPVLPASLTLNLHYYSLGASSIVGMQAPGTTTASDGAQPNAAAYDDAYEKVDKEVDIFNMLILPPVQAPAIAVDQLYANASVFCQQRRAFLLMDAPAAWTDAQTAMTGVSASRVGLVKDYSAIFYPDITILQNGLKKEIGPSGALAGLFARIDSTRGVWKAPAGTEADLRGITGLKYKFSDGENGVLNPKAINTIRVFPSGIVNWGARTNYGDDSTPHDYKYIPVRRTALFIEESLYRGLKWVVFEPNDEPLWAQIRLSVGAFMYNLYRQGAFKGAKKEAYFVKCDSETTTQNDINLGIVNVWVGFAPLKPAEFVILYLQQMSGQIEV